MTLNFHDGTFKVDEKSGLIKSFKSNEIFTELKRFIFENPKVRCLIKIDYEYKISFHNSKEYYYEYIFNKTPYFFIHSDIMRDIFNSN
jgi:hypothetical protein